MSINKTLVLGISNIGLSFIFASYIYTEWGYDFGDYYATAMHMFNNDYQLYTEAFQSKGPIYFIFIGLISAFIGWGYQQAHIVLSLTIALYIFSSWKLTDLFKYEFIYKLFLVCIFTIPLISLDSNSSIALFTVSLTNFGVYYLFIFFEKLNTPSFKKNNILIFNKSILIFFIAFLTRIDTLIYLLPSFLVYIYALYLKKLQFNFLLKNFLIMLAFLTIIFCLIFYSLNINIDDFLYLNFSFNVWYKENLLTDGSLFYRPDQFLFLMKTFLFPLSVLILFFVTLFDNKLKNSVLQKNKFYLSMIIFMCAFIALIYARSDKVYHALIIVTPMILFCSLFFDYLRAFFEQRFKRVLYYVFILILGINIYGIYPGLVNIINNSQNGFEQPKQYKEANEFISNYNIKYILGNDGWISVFSKNLNEKPINSILNEHFYRWDNYFDHEYIRKSHNLLIGKNNEYFLIDRQLLISTQIYGNNQNFKEIISVSSKITSGDFYDLYVIAN